MSKVHPMTQADLPRIAELEQLCFEDAWPEESFAFELEENPFSHPLVFEEEGKIIGYAILWIMFEQAQRANIGIDPACRKNGYGQTLLQACIDQAKEAGCETFSLEVRESNTPARNLYEKAGFVFLHRAKGYYANGEDALVMAIGL